MKWNWWWALTFVFFFSAGGYMLTLWYKDYQAKKNGVLIDVQVVHTPSICLNKHNKIGVLYNGERFSLGISSKHCWNGTYAVGDSIKVIYDRSNKIMLFPTVDTTALLVAYCSPFFFPFFLYFLYLQFLRQKKEEEEAKMKQRKKVK